MKARFSQSENTPPMTEPLMSELGYLADTAASQQTLQGTWQPPPHTDEYAVKLLKQMQIPDSIAHLPPMSPKVKVSQHINSWRKQKETISSAPQGLHFGHYQAAIHHPKIAKFDAKMQSLPLEHGFLPDKWKHIVNVKILKKAKVLWHQ